MGLLDYGQGKGLIGTAVQDYIDERFPICPICRTRWPRWEFKGKVDMENRMQFRCAECGSSFSITAADLTGISKRSKNPLFAVYARNIVAVNAVVKTVQGKKVTETYVKVEHIGSGIDYPVLKEGQEVTVEELQEIAARR